jgi:hypothetical protein
MVGSSRQLLALTNSTNGPPVTPLDTIAVSHVHLEVLYSSSTDSYSFIPLPIRKAPQNETPFQDFLNVFTGPQYTKFRREISKRYPRAAYSDQIARAVAVITDSSFNGA